MRNTTAAGGRHASVLDGAGGGGTYTVDSRHCFLLEMRADCSGPERARMGVAGADNESEIGDTVRDMEITHIIITRYNIGLYDGSYLRPPSLSPADWMIHRATLFHTYCVPSVKGQTCQAFKWLVLFDQATPQNGLANAVKDVRCAAIRSGITVTPDVVAWIRRNVTTEWVLTTRLDNDDALHRRFVEDLQEAARPRLECLCFTSGWSTDGLVARRRTWHCNPFISLVEPTDQDIRSVCDGPHGNAHQRWPYRTIGHEGRWLQIVHGVNVANAMAGTPVPMESLREGFPHLPWFGGHCRRSGQHGHVAENTGGTVQQHARILKDSCEKDSRSARSSQKLRILLFATEFPPARGYGLARYSWELVRALSASGTVTHVVTRNSGPDSTGKADTGPYVHNMRRAFPLKHFDWVGDMVLANVPMLERGLEVAEEHGPFDTITSHDWLAAHAAKSLSSTLGVPWLLVMHDTEVGKREGQLTRRQAYIAEMERWAAGHADHIVTTSGFMRTELRRVHGVPPEKLTVVPCGTNPDRYRSTTEVSDFRRLFAADGEKLVVFVGRLSPVKGIEDLIQAFAQLAAEDASVRLVLAGDGVLRDKVKETLEEAGFADRASFLGWVSDKVLGALYRAADVVIVPSRYEPFGMVALEAASCGAAVIASRVGGLAEIVDASGGAIQGAPGRDPEGLAEAMSKSLSDRGEADRTGELAQAHVARRYSWDAVAGEMSSIAAKLVRRREVVDA